MKLLLGPLNAIAKLRIQSRLIHCFIGENSDVYVWRFRVSDRNRLQIGTRSIVKASVTFERQDAGLVVGDRTFIGRAIMAIAEKIEVGNDVLISWGVLITDHNSHSLRFGQRANDILLWRQGEKSWDGVTIMPVRICDKAWIGFNSVILKGVTIGEGAIVGAGSVVTKDVEPWTIVAGNPARFIREIPPNER